MRYRSTIAYCLGQVFLQDTSDMDIQDIVLGMDQPPLS